MAKKSRQKRKKEKSDFERDKEKIMKMLPDLKPVKRVFAHFKLFSPYIYIPLLLLILALSLYLRLPAAKYRLTAYDPYFAARMAREIVETGKFPDSDPMAYFPVGRNMNKNRFLTPYAIAFLYKILHALEPAFTVEEAAKVYPPIFGTVAILFFFYFVANLFDVITALLSTLFLTVVQAFLYRTSGGFADKEPVATVFISLTLLFFIKALKEKNKSVGIIYAVVSGITLAAASFSWGGYQLLPYTMGAFLIFASLSGIIDWSYIYKTLIAIVVFITTYLYYIKDISIWREDHMLFLYAALMFSGIYVYIRDRKIFLTPWLQLATSFTVVAFVGLIFLSFITHGSPYRFIYAQYKRVMGIRDLYGSVHQWSVGEQQRPVWVWPGAHRTGWFASGGYTQGWKHPEGGNTWWSRFAGFLPLSFAGLFISLYFGYYYKDTSYILSAAMYVMFFFVSTIFVRLHFPLSYAISIMSAIVVLHAMRFALIDAGISGIYKMLGSPIFTWRADSGDVERKTLKEDIIKHEKRVGLVIYLIVIPVVVLSLLSHNGLDKSPEINDIARAIYTFFAKYVLPYLQASSEHIRDVSKLKSFFAVGSLYKTIMLMIKVFFGFFYLAFFWTYLTESLKRRYVKLGICLGLVLLVFLQQFSTSYLFSRGLTSSMHDDWLQGLLYLRYKTPEDSVIFTWWDYGYWIQYVGNRPSVTDGENALGSYNIDMGQMFMKKNAEEFFSYRKAKTSPRLGNNSRFIEFHTLNYTRPAYIIIDNTLIGKFYWVSHIGDDCLAYECGTQFFFLRGYKKIKDQQGNDVIIFVGQIDSQNRDYYGGPAQLQIRISQQGIVPELILFRNGDPDRMEQYIITKYAILGTKTIRKLKLKDKAKGFPGLILIPGNILYEAPERSYVIYVPEKAIDMLFTRLYFFDGAGVEDFIEKKYDSVNRIVKVFEIKYPEEELKA